MSTYKIFSFLKKIMILSLKIKIYYAFIILKMQKHTFLKWNFNQKVWTFKWS